MNTLKTRSTDEITQGSETLEQAQRRADEAERKLARLASPTMNSKSEGHSGVPHSGLDGLRKDSMMAHLLGSLEDGQNIGHYGRLVFAIVALRFLEEEDVVEWLAKDRDFSPEKAVGLIRQIESRGYSPPRRERILEWQSEQNFPILPNLDDPDCGNVYRSLKFPNDVYEHIQNYQVEKAGSDLE
jgi:hypothetical protein